MLADPAMGTQLKEEASPSADDMSNNSAIHRSPPLATDLPVGDDGSRHGGSLMSSRPGEGTVLEARIPLLTE